MGKKNQPPALPVYFVHLPRNVAKKIGSRTYYPIKKPCVRGHYGLGNMTTSTICIACRGGFVKRIKKSDPHLYYYRHKKANAKAKGIPFDIRLEDFRKIPIPKKCPVLGIDIDPLSKSREGAPSIDRINPELGYTIDNVRIISGRANRIKNNATQEELEMILSYIKTQKLKT